MLKKLLFSAMLLPILAFCADYRIVENGAPKAELIIGEKPTRTAQFAALEMQHCIKLMSDATLPIVASPSGTADTTEIYIGFDGDKYDFTGEEYVVSFKDGKIHLVGNDNPDYGKVDYSKEATFPSMNYYYRATLFAAYDFLEKACGFRFYSFGDQGIAFKPSKYITVEPFELRRKPDMDAFRAPYFEGAGLKDVSARDKNLLLQRWRSVYCYGYVNHNIYSIYYRYWKPSPLKGYKELFIEPHPEWFAKRETGRQSSHIAKRFYNGEYVPSQLCYSEDGPIKYFAEEANKVYHGEKVLGARFGDIKKLPKADFYYPIQPDDDQAVCQCPSCTKLMESDRRAFHFTWINKLAAESRKINPDIKWATLAYGVARRRPENLELDPNVSIQICMSMHAWWHPLVYKRQHDDYKEWVEHEGNKRMLTSWLYFLNPEIEASRIPFKPFPVLYPQHTGEYITEFLNDGLRGVFAEIAIKSHELEAYIMSRLIYDKSEDYHKIIDEYFDLYYGNAGSAMQDVYETIEEITFDPDNYPEEVLVRDNPKASYIAGIHTEKNNWTLGTPRRMNKIGKLVEKARKAASTPVEEARVEKFFKNIWGPAEEGYEEHQAHELMRNKPVPTVAITGQPNEYNGALDKVDFSLGMKFTDWKFAFGEEYDSKAELSMLFDSKYLYIQFKEDSDIPYKNKNEDFWRNGLELFFADKPGLDYKQIFIDVNGKCEFYSNSVVEGVERFEPVETKVDVKNVLNEDNWTVAFAVPVAAITQVEDGKPMRCNIIRSRFFSGEKSPKPYYFSPIFSLSHREGLERMGIIFKPATTAEKERVVEDIATFERLKKPYKDIPKDWEMDYEYPLKHGITKDGHFILFGKGRKLGFVHTEKFFPIALGEKVEFEVTGTCVGNAGCCIFMSNGPGMKSLGTNYITIHPTDSPETQKIVVSVPKSRATSVTHVRIGLHVAPQATLDITSLKVKIIK